jgi:multiple sugar transport system permease protein
MTTASALRPSLHRSRRKTAVSTGLYVLLVAVALVFVLPLLWPILRSFEPAALITAAPTGRDFTSLTVANYSALFGGSVHIARYLLNSVLVTLGTVVFTAVLSTLGGLGFGRFRFRGSTIMFLMILATIMIPFQAILTPMFIELDKMKLVNSLFGLMVVYTTFNLPFGLFVMRNTFAQVPREVEEAALVDGSSTMAMLRRVMLPLVAPGVVTVCIYTVLFSWTEFLAALTFLVNDKLYTLPVALLNIETGTFGQINYGVLEAGAVIAMIPVIVVFLALQRYYVAGFAAGAVVG